MNWIKLVLINLAVFFSLALILFIPVEIYYSIKDSEINSSNDRTNFWLNIHPNSKKNAIFDLKPGTYRHVGPFNEFDYEFNINKNGYKDPNFNLSKSIDVLIYGDSFTFGHGVESKNRFSAILSKKYPNFNIANMAYNAGFTSPHYLLHYLKNINLKPRFIFVGTFIGNDCQSDMSLTKIISSKKGGFPDLSIKDGYLQGQSEIFTNNQKILRYLSDNSSFFKRVIQRVYDSSFGDYIFDERIRPNKSNIKIFNSGQDPRSCLENIKFLKTLETECLKRNSLCRLINLLIPEGPRLDSNEKLFSIIMNNCISEKLECFNLTKILKNPNHQYYYPIDQHWNKFGHEIVASTISNQYLN